MAVFYTDISSGKEIEYNRLLADINKAESCPLYLKSTDYYTIFKTILLSLVYELEICLLDADFSDSEVEGLLGNDIDFKLTVDFEKIEFNDFSEIINKIKSSKDWRLSLFTSGTTGLPKKITHTYNSLTRNSKVSKKYSKDVWGYAYNPTHMAGLQVFFQALLNENSIVRLFDLPQKYVFEAVEKYKVSNISATPTFFRLLFSKEKSFSFVERITLGGEKFDVKLKENLISLFPNAKILNVYASTEAGSIFASEGEFFRIKDNFSSFVKIENEELFLHKELLGGGTEKKMVGDWYATGDLVEIIEYKPIRFKFLSRKNEMINVGGYKVNPNEIEEVLFRMKDVLDVRIFGKPNTVLGNIICAEIVVINRIEVSIIREYLSGHLQDFKIPRIIKFVESIEKTRTGKKKR